jgi:hypothetical protein
MIWAKFCRFALHPEMLMTRIRTRCNFLQKKLFGKLLGDKGYIARSLFNGYKAARISVSSVCATKAIRTDIRGYSAPEVGDNTE